MILALLCVLLVGCGSDKNNDSTSWNFRPEEQTTEEQTTEAVDETKEQIAGYYLSKFVSVFKNPHSIEIYNAYYYVDSKGKYYFTFELAASNDLGGMVESTYGNNDGLDPKEYSETLRQEEPTDIYGAIDNAYQQYSFFGNPQGLHGEHGYWVDNKYDTPAKDNGEKLDVDILKKYLNF